ncbi:hypothetical protein [Citricoccus sp. GCM10030269]|uniref:hypothetical protein n=1 Tax=Citricoccus sp. GCM10030269 TaxID=3273388 RepID=UPI00360C4727
MAWVKRGGGSGVGIYGQGLAAAGTTGRPGADDESRSSDDHSGGVLASPDPAEPQIIAPASRPSRWEDVRDNRIILDVLAHWVKERNEPEASMLYADAVEAFEPASAHLAAACQGQCGAGAHYQRTVAGGRFRDGG